MMDGQFGDFGQTNNVMSLVKSKKRVLAKRDKKKIGHKNAKGNFM